MQSIDELAKRTDFLLEITIYKVLPLKPEIKFSSTFSNSVNGNQPK